MFESKGFFALVVGICVAAFGGALAQKCYYPDHSEADAYAQGRRAEAAGVPATANPYASRSWQDTHVLEIQWLNGWIAEKETEGDKVK